MKQIPNLITLSNLFFGCVAITFILTAPTYLTTVNGEDYAPVMAPVQLYWGSFFIALAAIMDMFDGLAARLLKVESALGRELDSLADVVSFGVAPGMILFKLLWMIYMSEPGAMDTSMWITAPAFLIPCFGALRLAKYNLSSAEQKAYFVGLPIPAVGLFIAALPLVLWLPASLDISSLFINRWVLYGIIIVLCYLMNSKVRFFKWTPDGKGLAAWTPQMLLALTIIIGFPFLKFGVVPVAFVLYILLSLFNKKSTPQVSI